MNLFQFLKNAIQQKRIKNQQLVALQEKEVEFLEKEVEFSKLLEKAKLNNDDCMRSYLSGNISDQEMQEAKAHLKELANSFEEVRENIKFITQTRIGLNREIGTLDGEVTVYRSLLCGELAKEVYEEMAANRKLNEKLLVGYSAFHQSGDCDRSWVRFLTMAFNSPSENDLQAAKDKLKKDHELLRD